jgi:hypothetical protein
VDAPRRPGRAMRTGLAVAGGGGDGGCDGRRAGTREKDEGGEVWCVGL